MGITLQLTLDGIQRVRDAGFDLLSIQSAASYMIKRYHLTAEEIIEVDNFVNSLSVVGHED
jgi:hypothetical protein